MISAAIPIIGAAVLVGVGLAYAFGAFGGGGDDEEQQRQLYIQRQKEYDALQEARRLEALRQSTISNLVKASQSLSRAYKTPTQGARPATKAEEFTVRPSFKSDTGMATQLEREMQPNLKPVY